MKKSTKILLTTFIVLMLGIIAFMAVLLLKGPTTVYTEIPTETNLVVDTSAEAIDKTTDALKDRQVFFAGIGDGTIGKKGSLMLKNPASNEDICMKYSIYNEDTGELVFETDLIESSKAVNWIPGETLEPGTYNFSFVEQPFYQAEGSDGWTPLTTGNNHVVIEIAE